MRDDPIRKLAIFRHRQQQLDYIETDSPHTSMDA